jgi:hypothetical protein
LCCSCFETGGSFETDTQTRQQDPKASYLAAGSSQGWRCLKNFANIRLSISAVRNGSSKLTHPKAFGIAPYSYPKMKYAVARLVAASNTHVGRKVPCKGSKIACLRRKKKTFFKN